MKRIFEMLALLGMGAALLFGYFEGRKEVKLDAEREKPVQSSSHVSRASDGTILIQLDPASVALLGIRTQIVGLSRKRARITEAAVVRDGDALFVFRKTGEASFLKTPVQVDAVSDDGDLSVRGLAGGEAIVVRGAQLLFSEELKGQIQTGD